MVATVLNHRTIDRRDPAAGGAHRLIFYGFLLLFLGTATITLEYDILEPLFGIRFWYGKFYLIFSLVLDVAGVALIGGLAYMMYRRGWLKLPKLDYARPDRAPGDPDFDRPQYRREDWAFLWVLLDHRLHRLPARGRTAGVAAGTARCVGYALVVARRCADCRGVACTRPERAWRRALRLGLWWFHGVLALAFIALIPYTKVKHIFTAAGSLMVRDPQAAQRLPRIPESQDAPGVAKITDFNWKQLLNLDACTKCGRCHEACPARAVGAPLSPRDVILSLREFANATLESGTLPAAAELDVHGKAPGQVSMETLWSCRTCMACVEICPVAVEHVPIIVQMRRKLVEDGAMDPLLTKTLQTIHKTGNSFGESKRKRGAWSKTLPFKVKDARKEPVEVLWFVGDYASFDPRNQKVTQTFASLLQEAGVDFGILYDGESNAGNDVRRVGEEGLYEVLANANVAALKGATFKTIVTTDPHSYNTIRNEYPDFGGNFQIQHYTSFVKELFAAGKLRVTRPLKVRTTFHDPCHLGRFNKGYEAPRDVLKLLGCELIEMGRSRANSFCCGAGGGRIWIPDPVATEKPAQNRIKEAAAIPGLEIYVVSCPKDLTMFEDALKTTGNEGKFVVRELIELIREAIPVDRSEEVCA